MILINKKTKEKFIIEDSVYVEFLNGQSSAIILTSLDNKEIILSNGKNGTVMGQIVDSSNLHEFEVESK